MASQKPPTRRGRTTGSIPDTEPGAASRVKRFDGGQASGPHSARALKAWRTRRTAWYRAGQTERASKEALSDWCTRNGWKVIFFEGRTGAPRTGIVDAVLVRLAPRQPDSVEVRLVQLKAGAGGLTATEVKRLKAAASQVAADWSLAAFDGDELHFVPNFVESSRWNIRGKTHTVANTALHPTPPASLARRSRRG